MPAKTRFITGLRIVLLLAIGPGKLHKSGDMGRRIHPVVVRRGLPRPCKAGIVLSRNGPGGSKLAHQADEITLRDVYCAASPSAPRLAAGKSYAALKIILSSASRAFEDKLARTTVAQFMRASAQSSKRRAQARAAMLNSR